MNNNLLTRTLTGIVFIILLVGCILYGPQTFVMLFAVVSAMTIWEFCTILNRYADAHINRFITTIAGVYLFFAVFGFNLNVMDSRHHGLLLHQCAVFGFNLNVMDSNIFIPYLLLLLYLMVSELYKAHPKDIQNIAFTMMAQLYIALPFALLNVLTFVFAHDNGQGIYPSTPIAYIWVYVLSIFIFLWTNDTGAYCVGTLCGKHRLFPRLSPKKSWEGSIGGAVVALAASQIIASFEFGEVFVVGNPLMNRLAWGGLSLVVIIFGTWGDLFESMLKRRLGIKDSGNILPGHGGMLDRFDSALFAIPVAVIYISTLQYFTL
ncbi:MAG: phosphatidate cytidylyltransferase [Bacteroidales bacterium]|nr:phosphatidate cytidylyltransferase [Bacteroidales bacterium]